MSPLAGSGVKESKSVMSIPGKTSGSRELCRGGVRDERTARLQADGVGTIDASLSRTARRRREAASAVKRVGSSAYAARVSATDGDAGARRNAGESQARVYRLYREEGLAMRIRQRRRIRWSGAVVRPAANRPSQRWSMDLVSDCVSGGREGDSDVDHRGRLHAGMSGD